jgi:hypothetical protein
LNFENLLARRNAARRAGSNERKPMSIRVERAKLAAAARKEKVASITQAEIIAGQVAYDAYVARCVAIGAQPESLTTFIADWVDVFRAPGVEATEDAGALPHEPLRRDYGLQIYRKGDEWGEGRARESKVPKGRRRKSKLYAA